MTILSSGRLLNLDSFISNKAVSVIILNVMFQC